MANSHVLITRKRLLVLLLILIILIILLMTRVGYWSLWRGEDLKAQAESQWVKDIEVSAKRGSIMDRNQQILAQSAAADTVVLLPEKIEKAQNANEIADQLSQILGLDRNDIYEKATNTDKKEIWLKRQISTEQSEQIEALGLEGVAFRDDVKRFYPNKDFAAQVIGYTTLDGEGQTGIERRYNTTLAGRAGRQVAETAKDGSGVPNGQEMMIQPQDGLNVVLTIDEITQSFLESACKELYESQAPESVQGLVMDVTNGEILAMANIPEFDLNSPPREDAEALSALSTNVITATAYEPGNIFGIFTAAAAIDSGSAAGEYSCTGSFATDGDVVSCLNGAHGTQTLTDAVLDHCSVGAAMQANAMGRDVFYQYVKGFGFGSETGIDFSSDTAGSLAEKRYIRNADVAAMGAGEGLEISQIQLASAACALINGGTLYTPKLVLGLSDAEGNMVESYEPEVRGQSVTAETSAQVRTIMEARAKEDGISLTGYSAGAISGSAVQHKDGAVVADKAVATYIAYAPADDPKYMVMITATGVTATDSVESVCAPYVQNTLLGTLKNGNIMPDETLQPEETVTVPNVVGMELQEARDALADIGLQSSYDGSGSVVSQFPTAATEVHKNSTVALTMETKAIQPEGTEMVTVPDFTGMDMTQAKNTAIASGLVFVARGNGVVQEQSPAAGTQVSRGSSIVVDFKLQIAAAQ